MKWFTATWFMLGGLVAVGLVSSAQAQRSTSFTGTVQRVWEDGFSLNVGHRTLRVDSWDLCGDLTANYIHVGNHLTVSGEFERGEFDAFSITKPNGDLVC